MKPLAKILHNQYFSTIIHVILPIASVLVIAAMLLIGFSGQREPLIRTDSETGGATNLVFSGQIGDDAELDALAKTASFLPKTVRALNVSGTIEYTNGKTQYFQSIEINTDWDLSYARFESGTLSQDLENGSKLKVQFESGSAGFNGMVGQNVIATIDKDESTIHRLVSNTMFIKSGGTLATATGGAVWTFSGNNTNDWFIIESKGYTVDFENSVVLSDGIAEFEFYGGQGIAGQVKATISEDDGNTLELMNGVIFEYLEPKG